MTRPTFLPLVLAAAFACTTTTDTTDTTDEVGTDDSGTEDSTDTDILGDTSMDTAPEFTYEWPDAAEDYVWDDAVYLPEVRIPTVPSSCCKDFGPISKDYIENQTNQIDNALTNLGTALSLFGFNLNNEMDGVIRYGSFVGLLDFRDMPAQRGPFPLAFFLGAFEGTTTYTQASAGEGTFEVDPQSFKPNSGEPQVAFVPAYRDGDSITAEGDSFPLTIVFGGAPLTLDIEGVSIEGTLIETQGKVGIKDGELAGYMTVEGFLEAWNDLATASCSCSGLTGDLFEISNGDVTKNCIAVATIEAGCTTDETDFLCKSIVGAEVGQGGFCSVVPDALELAADIDTDGNTRDYEALSVGLRIRGVPADVKGLSEGSVLNP